ncbi:MAG: ribonuclease P protein component [Spirochaetes bacterium]|nr:ribonuclease P protein component [Spirochaetota bacterium]
MNPDRKKEDFKTRNRLKKREDFRRLLREGRRAHARQYSLVVAENGFECIRLGLSIRRRVGRAVDRNYEKRLCREFFRKEVIGEKKGFDVLIIIKHRSQGFEKSYKELEELFGNSELFHRSLK